MPQRPVSGARLAVFCYLAHFHRVTGRIPTTGQVASHFNYRPEVTLRSLQAEGYLFMKWGQVIAFTEKGRALTLWAIGPTPDEKVVEPASAKADHVVKIHAACLARDGAPMRINGGAVGDGYSRDPHLIAFIRTQNGGGKPPKIGGGA